MAEPNGRAALSRRGFIMGAASAGALSAIGGLLGCAPKEQAPAQAGAQAADGADPAAAGWLGQEPDIPESDIAKTLETEVLVVGGGTSGLFAAASAAENGAKTMVAEKFTGGGVRVGFGAVGSRLQKEAGVELDKQAVIRELLHYSNNNAKASLLQTWADYSGETVDWWQDRCAEKDIPVWFEPGGQEPGENYWYMQTCHSPQFAMTPDGQPAGPDGAQVLTEYCEGLGVEFQYNTAMVKLVKDGDRVSGIIATNADGDYVRINASKGVIVCTGGYGQNIDMLAALQPETLKKIGYSSAIPGTEGDGIKACIWAGAAFDDTHCSAMFDRACVKPDEVGGYGNGSGGWFWMGSQPFLKVNLKGERFMSESVPYDYVLQAALSQPDHTWCTVWDSNLVEDIYRFKTQGCSRYFEFENGAPPQIPLAAVMGMNEGLVADGFIQQADTVEELAEKLDIPADAFAATVARYNELYDQQLDEDFGKEAYRLSALRTPPFFGVRQTGYLLCTLDGIKIDEQMHALDESGQTIPGLFVAGVDSGGYYAHTYPSHSGGNCCGRNGTFGHLAGKYAALEA